MNSTYIPTNPPGWYPDPYDPTHTRYWDGRQWTGHTGAGQPFGVSAPPMMAPASSTKSHGKAIGIGIACAVGGLLIGGLAMAAPAQSAVTAQPQQQQEQSQNVAPEPAPTEVPADSADQLQDTFDATVVVYQETADGYGSGAAVAIDETTFLTANHVVDESDEAVIELQDGTTLQGSVIKRDPTKDLALIQTEAHGLPIATIAQDDPEVDEFVYAFGAPNGYVQMSSGYVTGVYDPDGDGVQDVETDASLRHGNSGGPLVNEEGEVVGISVWIEKEGGVYGYATSASEIWEFLEADSGWTEAAYN